MGKMWCIHTMEHYLAICIKAKVLIYAATYANLETLCYVREAHHKDHILYDSIYMK